jgi:hypothetical protein
MALLDLLLTFLYIVFLQMALFDQGKTLQDGRFSHFAL